MSLRRLFLRLSKEPAAQSRWLQSSASSTPSSASRASVQEMLSEPTWSIRTLLGTPQPSSSTSELGSVEKITASQLHHLLRLAALPLPSSPSQEQEMLETLQRQLHFVRALQQVDTKGVEPLRVVRDETAQGVEESTIGLADLQEALDKEEKIGFYRRPRRMREKQAKENEAEKWDALGMAQRKAGKYFVVDSGKRES